MERFSGAAKVGAAVDAELSVEVAHGGLHGGTDRYVFAVYRDGFTQKGGIGSTDPVTAA